MSGIIGKRQKRIIEYYNNKCDFILKEAEMLAKVKVNMLKEDKDDKSGFKGNIEFDVNFQMGYIDGRSAVIANRFNETENGQNLSRNLAMSAKLEAMRNSMENAYTDTYKIAWNKGKDKGKELDSAAMISLKSEISQYGAPGMANEVWAQFEKVLNTFLIKALKNVKGNYESEDAQKRKYASFNTLKINASKIIDETIFQNTKIEKLKEAVETAFDAVGTPVEADREYFKELKKEGRKIFRELPEAFNEGYSTALESGMRSAAREKAAEKPSMADDFYNAMLEAISNRSKPHYVKGYNDAGKMLKEMDIKGNLATEEEMKMSLQFLPNYARKRLLEAIEMEYKEFLKVKPDESDTEQLKEHKERKNNYKNILSRFSVTVSQTAGSRPVNEFLSVQMEQIIDELSGLTAEMPESTASFFDEKIENSWAEIIENYKKGFETAHPIELKEILDKRGGTITISQGIANFLGKSNEIIEEGSIEDADIGDIDLLQQQEEFIEQSQQLSAEADEQEVELTKLINNINILKRELNDAKNENSNLDALSESVEDQDILDWLLRSIEVDKSSTNDKEFELFGREADVKILKEEIDKNAKERVSVTEKALGFKASANTFAQLRQYMMVAMGRLNLVGKYKVKSDSSSEKGGGLQSYNDSDERV